MSEPFFNPLQDDYCADPFPHLREMRNVSPVQQTLAGPWALFAHRDVSALLRNPALSVDATSVEPGEGSQAALWVEIFGDEQPTPSTSILNIDPPDHTRLRRLVSKAFTPKAIEALRPMIQTMVDQVLDKIETQGGADVVDDLAFPLPFDVIIEMLGMPRGDTLAIRGWSEALVKTLDPIVTEAEMRAAVVASREMDRHIDGVIEWKRQNLGDDLLTALLEAEDDGDRLSPIELRDQVGLLFVAGHETTVNLIGTGIYELLRNPEQLERWLDEPEIESTAIDELLRYISPVQFSRRITTSDITIDECPIPARSFVLACLASANRDPEFWGDTADQLDLGRDNAAQHVSFGSGVHYCLGASLAKMEAQVAIGSFIRRFPNASLAADPTWNGRINLRGLAKLPVITK
ncbi:MAG: cytochrome P450 [Acidimicrobiales bacterium]